MSIEPGKWFTVSISIPKAVRRKDDFESYCEPFRTFNKEEYLSYYRAGKKAIYPILPLVSYQAQPGGFTICNILLGNKLYSGCSHCIKSDRWLPIRGKMNAFRRALEQSEGVELSQTKGESNG